MLNNNVISIFVHSIIVGFLLFDPFNLYKLIGLTEYVIYSIVLSFILYFLLAWFILKLQKKYLDDLASCSSIFIIGYIIWLLDMVIKCLGPCKGEIYLLYTGYFMVLIMEILPLLNIYEKNIQLYIFYIALLIPSLIPTLLIWGVMGMKRKYLQSKKL